MLKACKDGEIDIKYNTTIALANVLSGSGKAIREATGKDLLKIAKSGLSDKVSLIRAASAELLEKTFISTGFGYPLTLHDFEKDILLFLKSCDIEHRIQMNAFASLIFNTLVHSQRMITTFPIKKPAENEDFEDHQILTVEQMLSMFSLMYMKSKSNSARVVIIESFCLLYRAMGVQFIESNYGDILNLFLNFNEESSQAGFDYQNVVHFMLRDTIGKMLSESGQVRACRELIQRISGWTVEKSYTLSDNYLLTIFREMEALISDLGPATKAVDDEIVAIILKLLDHQSFAVKLGVASCARALCYAMPHNITPLMNKLTVLLQRDIGFMNAENQSNLSRLEGYIHTLSAIIAIIPHHKLYASVEDAGTIFGLATQILKSNRSSSDYSLQTRLVQMSWTLMGSLMCLGKNFVSAHLSQLLLFWKDTFPRMTASEAGANRSDLEWGYVLFKKDSSLAAMHNFLSFNCADLVTVDVAKRLIVCLSNAQQLISVLPSAYGPLDTKAPSHLHKTLYNRECLLKSRMFACLQLLPSNIYENMFGIVLRASVGTFAVDPDKIDRFLATVTSKDGPLFGSTASKDTSALCIESVYSTSLVTKYSINVAKNSGAETRNMSKDNDIIRGIDAHFKIVEIDYQMGLENDPHALYSSKLLDSIHTEPAVIDVVDKSIELFSHLFPIQNSETQESIIDQISQSAQYIGQRMTPIRKYACRLNSLVALIGALKIISGVGKGGKIKSDQVYVIISKFCLVLIFD